MNSALQIRRGYRDDSRDNFPYYSLKMYRFDPSFEPSRQDCSNEGSQHVFIKK